MKHLFLFTIGPVQSFIASARKTIDLFAGSDLLSCLCCEACVCTKELGGVIIFPYEPEVNESLPNRFIAVFEGDKNWKEVGVQIEEKVQEKFKEIADSTIKNIVKPLNFDAQIESHLDIHWIFNPIGKNERDAYNEIEQLMGAIKNERRFVQLGEEGGRKCNLDGVRNALFYLKNNERKPFALQDSAVDITTFVRERNIDVMFNPNESLSAVSFVKRMYGSSQRQSFPSTARVALMKTLNHSTINSSIKRYISYFGNDFDEQLFFEENLTGYFEKHKLEISDFHRTNILNQQNELKKKIKSLGLSFSSYYGLIYFDGDDMGRWFSGEYLDNSLSILNYQTKLSKILADYGTLARKIVSEPKGATVYAGGDDYLGFLNLDNLFETLSQLRNSFEISVNQKVKEMSGIDSTKKLNLSAGIAIAHYKMPLSEVLNYARNLEKISKGIKGKNAYTIGVMKHSGTVEQCTYKWNTDGVNTVGTLKEIIQQLKINNFTNNFIKNLHREFESMGDHVMKKDWMVSEVNRLVRKSCVLKINQIRNEKEKNKIIEDMCGYINSLLQIDNDYQNFLGTLNICDFIGRHITIEN